VRPWHGPVYHAFGRSSVPGKNKNGGWKSSVNFNSKILGKAAFNLVHNRLTVRPYFRKHQRSK
jgi:hypothetical protein